MAGAGVSQRRAQASARLDRAFHRARLGVRFVVTRFSVTPDEQEAERDRQAAGRTLLDERHLAAGELHWLLAREQAAHWLTSQVDMPACHPPDAALPEAPADAGDRAVLFLNVNQARTGRVGEQELPRDYVLACRFLRCSILDRTRTLDQGFDFTVLDPIPPLVDAPGSFEGLCDLTGERIVDEAIRERRRISVLWSGGIDSTTALIALIRAARQRDATGQIQVLLSAQSVDEHPRFFLDHIRGQLAVRIVAHPVSAYLDPADLNVTGEHGDQLFGSHLLEPYVRRGVAHLPYRDVLPFVLAERMTGIWSARRVERYLAPVIDAAPVRIASLFDYLWWCNFALKWQEVILRMTAFRGDDAGVMYASLRHFFRHDHFQQWAMANTPGRQVPVWRGYKDEAKRYIRAFTADEAYYRHKEKEDSLRHVMANQASNEQLFVVMRGDFQPQVRVVDRTDRGLVSMLTRSEHVRGRTR